MKSFTSSVTAVILAAGKGTRVATKKGKMGREFLAKRHSLRLLLFRGLWGGSLPDCKPTNPSRRARSARQKSPGPVLAPYWNNRRSFLFPSARRPFIRAAEIIGPWAAGTAALELLRHLVRCGRLRAVRGERL